MAGKVPSSGHDLGPGISECGRGREWESDVASEGATPAMEDIPRDLQGPEGPLGRTEREEIMERDEGRARSALGRTPFFPRTPVRNALTIFDLLSTNRKR